MRTAINAILDANSYFSNELQTSNLEPFSFDTLLGKLAYHAMMLEVHLTPKPGLVDTANNGSHYDMDLQLFEKSAGAIYPFFTQFCAFGKNTAQKKAPLLLSELRPIGIAAECAMFKATNGINTHKGMIFSLGLVCVATGWLRANRQHVSSQDICAVISECCNGLVQKELHGLSSNAPLTQGEKLYLQYGVTGARGEAESGFSTIANLALPAYRQAIKDGLSVKHALWQTLLVIMANNKDTNVLSRGGMEGLNLVQQTSLALLSVGGAYHPEIEENLNTFDQTLISLHLSPGGSADLLALTWLLAELDEILNRT